MIKIVIGIAIIVLSFAFIMKNHDKSMMDKLMEKRKNAQEQEENPDKKPPTQS